jgi:hypothetical protein
MFSGSWENHAIAYFFWEFAREFISYYPEPALVRTFYAPTGLPVAVLFKVH